MTDREPRQHDTRQFQPPFDPAPLILTLTLAPDDQARFDRLRAAHFPPDRNHLSAHLTLFHHLPPEECDIIRANLATASAGTHPFPVRVAKLRSLGRGTAFTLESEPLLSLRSVLARTWWPTLTPQDRQGYKPHITIQNKVSPDDARRLLQSLSTEFAPFTILATGLALWRYRGGPWQPDTTFPFPAA